MENLDIIILTSILSTLFVVFGIWTYKELSRLPQNESKIGEEGGPRVKLVKFMQRMFDGETEPKKKKKIYKSIKRTISDMESEGVYFSVEIKEKLEEQRKELTCEYSGLSSVRAYQK